MGIGSGDHSDVLNCLNEESQFHCLLVGGRHVKDKYLLGYYVEKQMGN